MISTIKVMPLPTTSAAIKFSSTSLNSSIWSTHKQDYRNNDGDCTNVELIFSTFRNHIVSHMKLAPIHRINGLKGAFVPNCRATLCLSKAHSTVFRGLSYKEIRYLISRGGEIA